MPVGQGSMPTVLALATGTSVWPAFCPRGTRYYKWRWQRTTTKRHTHSSAWMESEGAT